MWSVKLHMTITQVMDWERISNPSELNVTVGVFS